MSWGRILFHMGLLVILLYPIPCFTKVNHHCPPSSCGNTLNISYPFRLKGDPRNCGDPNYELSCQNNQTVLNLYNGKYFVKNIDYNNLTIRVADVGVKEDNCSSMPLYTLTFDNFSSGQPYTLSNAIDLDVIAFLSCKIPIESTSYVDTCVKGMNASVTYSYALIGDLKISDLKNSCRVDMMVMALNLHGVDTNLSYKDILQDLSYGVELSWGSTFEKCKAFLCPCYRIIIFIFIGIILVSRFLFGIPFIFVYLKHKWRRRHLSVPDTVEEFLRNNNNLMPIRYSYSAIKRITKGFKHKLGEGGYGSVYKGQLRSGRQVAIKMLGGKSKANGQEFINEVATIGRIHHVNVVHLIGFCVEGSKRALVYEFMPNGSLDKHIFSREGKVPLSCEKMFEIALGVARGIEYLHRGCDMRILHFDIKPHNILLDENFTPKVSDFGLAKLYPIENSIVSLTAARGTMGYMAPELFYKNIGGISYKADVYSFGMLLMEIASRRRNMNDFADRTSQVYFPPWIYNQFSEGKEIELENATEEDKEILKKMIIVAFWCILMKPSDRPSMNKVVELLEGDLQSLQMPPKPFQTPKGMPAEGIGHFGNLPWLPPGGSSDSPTFFVNAHRAIQAA